MTHSCISTHITCVNVAETRTRYVLSTAAEQTHPPRVETSASSICADSRPSLIKAFHTNSEAQNTFTHPWCSHDLNRHVCDRSRCLIMHCRTASHGLITDHMMLLLVSESYHGLLHLHNCCLSQIFSPMPGQFCPFATDVETSGFVWWRVLELELVSYRVK